MPAQPQPLPDPRLKIQRRGDEGEDKVKLVHLTLEDKMEVGRDLIQVLQNYLPDQQSKLNVLGGKVLEIFYEEFIKFVPAYILRREEERKKQQ